MLATTAHTSSVAEASPANPLSHLKGFCPWFRGWAWRWRGLHELCRSGGGRMWSAAAAASSRSDARPDTVSRPECRPGEGSSAQKHWPIRERRTAARTRFGTCRRRALLHHNRRHTIPLPCSGNYPLPPAALCSRRRNCPRARCRPTDWSPVLDNSSTFASLIAALIYAFWTCATSQPANCPFAWVLNLVLAFRVLNSLVIACYDQTAGWLLYSPKAYGQKWRYLCLLSRIFISLLKLSCDTSSGSNFIFYFIYSFTHG